MELAETAVQTAPEHILTPRVTKEMKLCSVACTEVLFQFGKTPLFTKALRNCVYMPPWVMKVLSIFLRAFLCWVFGSVLGSQGEKEYACPHARSFKEDQKTKPQTSLNHNIMLWTETKKIHWQTTVKHGDLQNYVPKWGTKRIPDSLMSTKECHTASAQHVSP